MQHVTTWLSFFSGCAVMLVAGWLTADVRAQGGDEAIQVCVAEDGVLRLASTGPCPSGQKSLHLKKAGGEIEQPDEPKESRDESRLEDLDRRIKALERSPDTVNAGNRVVAPFEVTDRDGKPIFRVDDGSVNLYNSGGQVVATIRADGDGGVFAALSPAGNLTSSLGARGAKAGIEVNENDSPRISFGKQDTGTFSARFFGKSGVVAAIGQAGNGAGAAWVGDGGNQPKAIMMITQDANGHIGIQNAGGTAIAELTQGKSGGGLLTIGDSGGKRMVAAGVQPGGFGVVQTGPGSFMTAAGLGLPGSYIMGKP